MNNPHDPRTWHWVDGMPESLANTEVKVAVKTLTIRRNADHTLTVKVNHYLENISIQDKSEEEIFEGVRYALVCANFEWNEKIAALVRQEMAK